MWYAKIKLRHDCFIGNRCKKFRCKSLGYPLEGYQDSGYYYFLHFEKLIGDEKNIKRFINDLKKDKCVANLEVTGNLLFFSYKTKNKDRMLFNTHLKKVLYVKPIIVDETGYETLEVCTWDREVLNQFIAQTRKDAYKLEDFKIEKIIQTDLNEVYFSKVMPELTITQSRALSLAIEFDYYGYPRKIELKDLAKKMKIALSTYREHLRIAERKVMPLMV